MAVKPLPRPAQTPAEALKQALRDQALALGADLVGFAPVERWAEIGEVPPDYRPEAIFPGARSVIVVGVPMLLPVIESTPSINYQEMYDTSNRLLDEIAYRLATGLNRQGYPTLCLPRDGYASLEALLINPFGSFSHTYAAKYAGLGTVGVSRNLLVPEYGPRLRLNSVITSAEIPPDPLLAEELCTKCGLCEKTCPARAIRTRDDGILGDLDKDECTRHHIVLRDEGHWPCGTCAKVCPIGADRKHFAPLSLRRYLDEAAALAKNPDDPTYRRLVHLRRHGSRKVR
ncbi:MAG: Epoxyqueuosine reductase [Pseudomonadota bacterium]|jgi:epoxyqueuosine reductase QueG